MVTTRPRTQKTRKQSAALIRSNDDLLIEILLRLPVTSVLRFKSVSKHWQSLLSRPPFTLLYKNGSNPPGFFVHNLYIPYDVENQSSPPFPDFDSYHDPFGIRIVQSCNGLLLCCGNQEVHHDRKYYVFNPSTRQIALIPPIPGRRCVSKTMFFMCLAFHSTDCPHYKVVCFQVIFPSKVLLQIQIYSSETGKWKISNQSFHSPSKGFCNGVYLNQTIYWAFSYISDNPLYFKLDTEELQSLPLPVRVGNDEYSVMPLYFGESRGHLHLVEKARENHLHQLIVYEMLNDRSGWFLKYRVELDELLKRYPQIIRRYRDPSIPLYYDYEVLDVVRGEEDDETFMVISIPGKIILRYNVADKSFKHICHESPFNDGPIGFGHVNRYVETIFSF